MFVGSTLHRYSFSLILFYQNLKYSRSTKTDPLLIKAGTTVLISRRNEGQQCHDLIITAIHGGYYHRVCNDGDGRSVRLNVSCSREIYACGVLPPPAIQQGFELRSHDVDSTILVFTANRLQV